MKDVIATIKSRRCVREYKDDSIPFEYLEFLIDCARYALSGFKLIPGNLLAY